MLFQAIKTSAIEGEELDRASAGVPDEMARLSWFVHSVPSVKWRSEDTDARGMG